MAKPTQKDLIAAHVQARYSADLDTADKSKINKVPEIVDPNREPLPWPVTEDPFGGNLNNRAVAERIAKQAATVATTGAPLSASEAALRDLKAASGDNSDANLTDEQKEAKQAAELAAQIAATGAPAGAAAPVPPDAPPAWKPKA